MSPPIDAVLFDKDGTLADSAPFLINIGHHRIRNIEGYVPGMQDALMQSFGLLNSSIDPAGLLAVGSRYENEVAAASHIANKGYGWADALAIATSAFEEADRLMPPKANQTPLFHGIKNLLDTILHNGLRLGLLSADSSRNVEDFVQTHQLADYFQLAMGIDRPPGKPDPALIQSVCSILGVAPHRLLVIGDSPVDIQLAHAGQAAGCIAVTWGGAKSECLQQAEAIAHTIHDIQIHPAVKADSF